MPSTRYGRSCWLEAAPPPRPSWGRLRGETSCDVAVVGGGLAGCAATWTFAQAGVSTVLLEADLVGRRATAGAPGLFDAAAATSFWDLRERHGLRAARLMWEAERRACVDAQTLIKKLRIRCRATALSLNTVAITPEQASLLEREHRALTEAGFDASWLTGKRAEAAAGVGGFGVMRRTGAFAADPLALAAGLARAALRRKAAIFERSPVRRIVPFDKGVDLITTAGRVRAGTVVVATDTPQPGMKALQRHLHPTVTAAAVVPGLSKSLQRSIGISAGRVVCDVQRPQRAWRLDGEGTLILWQSDQPPAPSDASLSAQRVGQLMYEYSVLHPDVSGMRPSVGWTVHAHRSADGLLIAGPHRAFPRHLFAVGLGAEGLQGALLAAGINLRHYQGRAEKADELFGFLR